MENSNLHFDVIISGGGLSGSLMALSLSHLNKKNGEPLSIAIVEALPVKQTNQLNVSPVNNNQVNTNQVNANQVNSSQVNEPALFDGRVLALSHGSAKYLNKLGTWQYLKSDACAITDIDISDRGHFAKTRLTAREYNVNALGYVIDMASIGKAQLKALSKNTTHNIQWFSPDSIVDIKWNDQNGLDNNHVKVTLNSNKSLTASLLLGCDGVQSPVRKLANIDVTSDDYHQVALIANVSTSKPHNNKAFERFTEFGPIAMLPLTSIRAGKASGQPSKSGQEGTASRCSLVWTMTPEQAKDINNLSDAAFKTELERAFGSYLGAITHVGKRDTYPLVLLQAQQQTYFRTALVGNASHTIHPIAGQGFNLGLRDVEVMTELVSQALKADQDIGNFDVLHRYQLNRVNDQQQVINLTDSLVTLFANDLPPLVVGRNIALQALNVITPFKDALVKKTMGY